MTMTTETFGVGQVKKRKAGRTLEASVTYVTTGSAEKRASPVTNLEKIVWLGNTTLFPHMTVSINP